MYRRVNTPIHYVLPSYLCFKSRNTYYNPAIVNQLKV